MGFRPRFAYILRRGLCWIVQPLFSNGASVLSAIKLVDLRKCYMLRLRLGSRRLFGSGRRGIERFLAMQCA